jgi:hypothetical protein
MTIPSLEERCANLSEELRELVISDLVKPMKWNPYQNKQNIPVYKYGLTEKIGKRLSPVIRKPSEKNLGSLALGSKVYGTLTTEPAQRVYYGMINVDLPQDVISSLTLWEAAYFFAGAGITKWDDMRNSQKTFSRPRLERMDLYSVLLSSMQNGVRYLQRVHEKYCRTHASLPYTQKILNTPLHELLPIPVKNKEISKPKDMFAIIPAKQRQLFDNRPLYWQVDM